jgi:hypothetical protein
MLCNLHSRRTKYDTLLNIHIWSIYVKIYHPTIPIYRYPINHYRG